MYFETLKIAIRSLYSNKMRTLLSMLGIIIGVRPSSPLYPLLPAAGPR